MAEIGRQSIQCLLIIIILGLPAVRAADNASVVIEASTQEMTPGQQFELRLTVTHDEGVEAVFNPRRQSWGKLEFIDYRIVEPRWQQGQWVSVYILRVATTVAGSDQLPKLRVSFYREADHWNIETLPLPYEVISPVSGTSGNPATVAITPDSSTLRTGESAAALCVVASATGGAFVWLAFWCQQNKARAILEPVSYITGNTGATGAP